MAPPAPFVIQPSLTGVTLTYRNARLIADEALPRVPVDSPLFKYSKYAKGDAFTVPDTLVGRKGKVNEIDWSATEETDQVEDHGLEDPIPYFDTAAARSVAGAPIDPEAHSTELLTDLLALDREKRVADLLFDAANYATGSKVDVSDTATDQWSDFTTPSNPLEQITAALDSMIVPANVFLMGRAVATKLRQHPMVIKAFNANLGDSGIVPLEFLRTLFGFDRILVGEGWINTAKKGKTPTLARVWGGHAALLYLNPLVRSTQGGITFGFTAEWGTRVAGTRQDPDIGLRGGTRVRVGESVKELVVASDAGYLFENAIA